MALFLFSILFFIFYSEKANGDEEVSILNVDESAQKSLHYLGPVSIYKNAFSKAAYKIEKKMDKHWHIVFSSLSPRAQTAFEKKYTKALVGKKFRGNALLGKIMDDFFHLKAISVFKALPSERSRYDNENCKNQFTLFFNRNNRKKQKENKNKFCIGDENKTQTHYYLRSIDLQKKEKKDLWVVVNPYYIKRLAQNIVGFMEKAIIPPEKVNSVVGVKIEFPKDQDLFPRLMNISNFALTAKPAAEPTLQNTSQTKRLNWVSHQSTLLDSNDISGLFNKILRLSVENILLSKNQFTAKIENGKNYNQSFSNSTKSFRLKANITFQEEPPVVLEIRDEPYAKDSTFLNTQKDNDPMGMVYSQNLSGTISKTDIADIKKILGRMENKIQESGKAELERLKKPNQIRTK